MTDLSQPNALMRPAENPATRFNNPAAQPTPMLGQRQMRGVIAPPAQAPPAFPQGNQLMQPMQQMQAPQGPMQPQGQRPRSMAGLDKQVSTALPSKKVLGHDPHERQGLNVSLEAMRGAHSPKAAAKFNEAMAKLQASGDYDHIPPVTGDFAEDMTRHMHDNLVHIWQNIRGRPWVEHAANWYNRVHDMTGEVARNTGLEHHQVAAVTAALSPKKDWDQNFNLAERLIDIHKNHQDKVFSEPMRAFVRGTIEARSDEAAKKAWLAKLDSLPPNARLDQLLHPVHQAMFVRAFDEAGHEQHGDYKYKGNKGYDLISPTGERHQALTKEGAPATVTWQTYPAIASAMMALRGPELRNTSLALGERHKVRSFYNNIMAPDSMEGHYTADTHAIAASHLMPLGVKHAYVKHGLGSGGVLGEAAITGVKGLYPLMHEAGRRAADTIGRMEGRHYLPREVQSPIWEATRAMFEGKKDPKGHVAQTAEHVQRYARYGLIRPDVARQWIINAAGGVPDPTWWERRKR